MCVEKYTYDVRNLGQAEGAHKVGASARTSRKTTKTLVVFVESEASTYSNSFKRLCLKLIKLVINALLL